MSDTTRLATIVSATANGETAVQSIPDASGYKTASVLFVLNVTALTGSATPTMLVSIVIEVDGVDVEVGAFAITVSTGAQTRNLVIDECPQNVKVKYVEGGTVTDFDATVDAIRS